MKEVKVLGIDIAKNVFQLHGVDKNGAIILKKRLTRNKLSEFIANLPPCLIGMEACAGSNYWALKFKGYGHEVKLMSPQYVKPYVKTNKNDANDAEAICEAVTRPTMRFVSIKSKEQQAIQCIHRIRTRLVHNRTALINQMRSFLLEYGITIPQGGSQVRSKLIGILEEHQTHLPQKVIILILSLFEELCDLYQKITKTDKEIEIICKENEDCRRLLSIRGIGPIGATALVSTIGNINIFKNGRQLAAWLGLVPRQSSSGNKNTLLGISKRGDKYIRSLLIHGARSAVSSGKNITSFEEELIKRRGPQKAYVAIANRNARIVWALLSKKTTYEPNNDRKAS